MKLVLTENITAGSDKGFVSENSITEAIIRQQHLLLIAFIMAAIFVFFTTLFMIQEYRRKQLWGGKHIYKNRRKNSDWFFLSAYRFLLNFPPSRGYIEKIAYRYRLVSPCDSKIIARKTVCACLISWVICILSFFLIFFQNPHLITLITAGVAIVLINSEVVGRIAQNFEINILLEIQRMIFNVEHNYYVEYRVDDALYRSMDGLSSNMRIAAEQIYQLLLSDDKEKALRDYYENVPNKYLRTFVSLCAGVMERGDQTHDGKLLLIRNMGNLQREIEIEIDKLQRLRMEFIGILLCVISPVFCIDFVKRFAINIKENMDSFFYGKEGFLFDIALLTIIVIIYFILQKSAEYRTFHQSGHRFLKTVDRLPVIKLAMDNYCNKNTSRIERLKRELRNNGSNIHPRHFILRSFLLAAFLFLLATGVSCYLHALSRERLLNAEREDIAALTSVAKEKQYDGMCNMVETYMAKYLAEEVEVPDNEEQMKEILRKEGTFLNNELNKVLAREILRRLDAYHKEHYSLLDLVISLLLGITTYYIPKLVMKYSAAVSKDAMEDEVNQFNALIDMLMYVDSMTVKQILEELEAFAVVYKQSIRICINNYSAGDFEALTELKEREPYDPFRRIVDNLLRCDDMPIYQAFHEIDVEREGYMAKRKLANEKSIRKRVFRAYLLAAVPLLLLFAYGIVPTLLSSIHEINGMLEELQGSSW
jgi:hypothetical protein